MTHAHAGGGNKGRGPHIPAGSERTSEGTSEATSLLPNVCQGRAGAAHTNPSFPVPRQGEVIQRQSLSFASLVFSILDVLHWTRSRAHPEAFSIQKRCSHPGMISALQPRGCWLQNPQAGRWPSITTAQKEDCAPKPHLADSTGSEERAEKHSSRQWEWDTNRSSPIPCSLLLLHVSVHVPVLPKGNVEQAEAVCHPR